MLAASPILPLAAPCPLPPCRAPLQIRERADAMKAEHARLAKSIAALRGVEGWREEIEQLEQARGRWAGSASGVRGAVGTAAGLPAAPPAPARLASNP